MPVNSCQQGGRPGFRFGDRGKCFTYPAGNDAQRAQARQKAQAQERAARASGFKEKK